MYGIMSRGYICPIVPDVLIDVRPTITGQGFVRPTIDDAAKGPEPGAPTIRAGEELVPEIRGAEGDPPLAPVDPPSITGGNVIAPVITSGEED